MHTHYQFTVISSFVITSACAHNLPHNIHPFTMSEHYKITKLEPTTPSPCQTGPTEPQPNAEKVGIFFTAYWCIIFSDRHDIEQLLQTLPCQLNNLPPHYSLLQTPCINTPTYSHGFQIAPNGYDNNIPPATFNISLGAHM